MQRLRVPSCTKHFGDKRQLMANQLITCANVCDQVLNALLGEELGKQAWPVRLYCDASSLDDGVDVVSLRTRTGVTI